jgi:hypothetical protein
MALYSGYKMEGLIVIGEFMEETTFNCKERHFDAKFLLLALLG